MRFVIDPGHGPGNVKNGVYDPGASGNGIEEAAYVMAFALKVAERLRKKGHETKLTREAWDKTDKPISKRVRLSDWADCDAYLAIHCNAAPGPSGSGTEVFVSKRKAAHEAGREMSAAVADALQIPDRGLKIDATNHFAVIRLTSCPAILLEIGFVSNPYDAAQMLSMERRDLAIDAVVKTLCLI